MEKCLLNALNPGDSGLAAGRPSPSTPPLLATPVVRPRDLMAPSGAFMVRNGCPHQRSIRAPNLPREHLFLEQDSSL